MGRPADTPGRRACGAGRAGPDAVGATAPRGVSTHLLRAGGIGAPSGGPVPERCGQAPATPVSTAVVVRVVPGAPLDVDQPVVPAANGPSSSAASSCGLSRARRSPSVTTAQTRAGSASTAGALVIHYSTEPGGPLLRSTPCELAGARPDGAPPRRVRPSPRGSGLAAAPRPFLTWRWCGPEDVRPAGTRRPDDGVSRTPSPPPRPARRRGRRAGAG